MREFREHFGAATAELCESLSKEPVKRFLADLRAEVAGYPKGTRRLAMGRIGPARETPTGNTLRLVAVVGQAGLRITHVNPPTGGQAA